MKITNYKLCQYNNILLQNMVLKRYLLSVLLTHFIIFYLHYFIFLFFFFAEERRTMGNGKAAKAAIIGIACALLVIASVTILLLKGRSMLQQISFKFTFLSQIPYTFVGFFIFLIILEKRKFSFKVLVNQCKQIWR